VKQIIETGIMKTPGIPNIQLYFNEACELSVARTRRSGDDVELVVEIPMDVLLAGPNTEVEQRLGEGILRHLAVLYPHLLSTYAPSDRGGESESDVAHELIRLSIRRKTSAYVTAIDTLLATGGARSPQTKEFQENSWPAIKLHLASLSPN
jgi:hypothetical protein